MAKSALFNKIRGHIKNMADSRLAEWKKDPTFSQEQLNKEFDLFDKEIEGCTPKMNVYEDDINKILSSGRFKNQFETQTSNGNLNNKYRSAHTHRNFGTEIGKTAPLHPEDAEKYGYVRSINPDEVYGYGDYTVNFKPSVKDNMTIHIGDSLGDEGYSFIPGDHDTYPAMMYHPSSFDDLSAKDYIDGLHRWEMTGPFIEAQFHGPLTTQDIKSIKHSRDKVSPFVKSWSEDNHIPLYDENGCYSGCLDRYGNEIEF